MKSLRQQLKPVQPSDKVLQAVSALHDYIIEGNLRPGTELPPESAMAQQRRMVQRALPEQASSGFVLLSLRSNLHRLPWPWQPASSRIVGPRHRPARASANEDCPPESFAHWWAWVRRPAIPSDRPSEKRAFLD